MTYHLKRRLLVVEDEPIAWRILCEYLLALIPCHIDSINNGYQAVERACLIPYQAIFMDIGLPGLNGLDACRLIKGNQYNACYYTPIVAVTAHTDPVALEHYYQVGMDAIWLKPIRQRTVRQLLLAWGWLN